MKSSVDLLRRFLNAELPPLDTDLPLKERLPSGARADERFTAEQIRQRKLAGITSRRCSLVVDFGFGPIENVGDLAQFRMAQNELRKILTNIARGADVLQLEAAIQQLDASVSDFGQQPHTRLTEKRIGGNPELAEVVEKLDVHGEQFVRTWTTSNSIRNRVFSHVFAANKDKTILGLRPCKQCERFFVASRSDQHFDTARCRIAWNSERQLRNRVVQKRWRELREQALKVAKDLKSEGRLSARAISKRTGLGMRVLVKAKIFDPDEF